MYRITPVSNATGLLRADKHSPQKTGLLRSPVENILAKKAQAADYFRTLGDSTPRFGWGITLHIGSRPEETVETNPNVESSVPVSNLHINLSDGQLLMRLPNYVTPLSYPNNTRTHTPTFMKVFRVDDTDTNGTVYLYGLIIKKAPNGMFYRGLGRVEFFNHGGVLRNTEIISPKILAREARALLKLYPAEAKYITLLEKENALSMRPIVRYWWMDLLDPHGRYWPSHDTLVSKLQRQRAKVAKQLSPQAAQFFSLMEN